MTVSVIVPVYNEEAHLEACLKSILPCEVIVVDGGSTDQSIKVAKKYPVQVISSEKGLARQCNAGAAKATGDILLFLAADCKLPPLWLSEIEQAFSSPYVGGAGFRLCIEGKGLFFKMISFFGNLRGRWVKMSLPDQGLVVRKCDYEALKGMNESSLIPFAELSFQLKKRGEWVWFATRVLSSPRKWLTHGKWKTTYHHRKTWLRFLREVS